MFNIGWSEIVVIGVVALIAIGPKELPGVLRMIGQWTGKVRRMANEFQGQFQEALREAEMSDVRKELESIGAEAANIGEFDPVADTKKEIESAMAEPLPAEAATPASDIAQIEGATPLPEAPSPVTEAAVAPHEAEPVTKQAGSGA